MKRINNKATIFYDKIDKLDKNVSFDKIDYNYDLKNVSENNDDLVNNLKYIYKCPFENIKRGDVIQFNEKGCEKSYFDNDNLYIWNGMHLEFLDFTIDPYGSIPKSFKVGKEFPLDYWVTIILFNKIIYLEEEFYHQMNFEWNEISQKFETSITIQNKIYTIVFYDFRKNSNILTKEEINQFILSYPYLTINIANNTILNMIYKE
jgi:hypothetical protein